MPTTEMLTELALAAQTYLDKAAIYHQDFAGNCFEVPSERCAADGLGTDRFDCSGLVIASLQDVIGGHSADVAARHVREMWQAAELQTGYRKTGLAIGALVVMRRSYTIKGADTNVPGHVGIVLDITRGVTMIHANAKTGKVEETRLRNPKAIMGYIVPAF